MGDGVMTVGRDRTDRVGFAVGSGRCGTHLLSQLFARERHVASSHERNRTSEAFQRYCRWYRLPVDDESFIAAKEEEIVHDLKDHEFSFEASSLLSLSVEQLHARFGARFVLMTRRPDEVVNSFWGKEGGVYERPYIQGDPSKALGYQQLPRPHHAFSRFAPIGPEFVTWNRMTRVGKIAWLWNVLNMAVWDQFQRIPATHRRVVKLEEFSFPTYRGIAEFFGVVPTQTSAEFARVASSRPGKGARGHPVDAWSPDEIREFEEQVRPAAELLGYDYRVAGLQRPRSAPPVARIRSSLATSVRRALQHLRPR